MGSGTIDEGMVERESSSSRRRNPVADASNWKPLSPSTILSPTPLLSLKSVTLHDWWLVQSQDNGIAIEGFAYRPLVTRQFCSAPIVKRHDSITLETSDGVTVIVGGMINRLRTIQNGFPVSVCNWFVLGFPFHWEELTAQFYSGNIECSSSVNLDGTLMPASFDDLSVIQLRDLVMGIDEGCEDQFWEVLLQQPNDDNVAGTSNKGGSNGEEGDIEKGHSEMEGEGPVVVTPSSRRVVGRDGGVMTRSMCRKKKQEEEGEENAVKGSESKKRPWKGGQ